MKRTIIGLLCACLMAACSNDSATHALQTESCGLDPADIGRFIEVPTGSFIKGFEPVYPEERPTLSLQVAPFLIQVHEVTNAQFAAFVEATGYQTDAEQSVSRGDFGAGSAVFYPPGDDAGAESLWQLVPGATWRTPTGPGSSIDGLGGHPVVHVSQADARAYAAWAGGRLPSEVEWEYAASLGLVDPDAPNSGAYGPDGEERANTWQGIFPVADTGEDGFQGIAPAGCFPASKIGVHDLIGNVWEWTDTPYNEAQHTIKGGSFLCAENFCRRYRPAARQPQDSDFSTSHIGFRIVKDVPAT